MRDVIEFCTEQKFYLPKFAFWTIDDWKSKDDKIREIIDNQLGWDITDFGSGDFFKTGLLLFTIRNRKFNDISEYAKPYCERLLITEEEQVTPMHHQYSKREAIINRGGGILQIEIYISNEKDNPSNEPVSISIDGVKKNSNQGE